MKADERPRDVATRIVLENALSPFDDYVHLIAEWVEEILTASLAAHRKLCVGIASASFFRSIPPEIWEKIATRLSCMDLFRCELVNKRFSALVNAVWPLCKSFEVVDLLACDQSAVGSKAKALEAVVVDGATDEYFRRFQCLLDRVGASVQELTFTLREDLRARCREHFASEAVILEIAKQAPHLKRLHFVAARLTPAAVSAIYRLSSLESLSLLGFDFPLSVYDVPKDVEARARAYEQAITSAVALLTQLKELRMVSAGWPHALPLSVLGSVSCPLLRVLELDGFSGCHLSVLRSFVQTHGELVKLSIIGFSTIEVKLIADYGPSLIRSLIDSCPKLKQLHLGRLGPSFLVDARSLHDLDSLAFTGIQPGAGLRDDDVIEICKHNPALSKFDIDFFSDWTVLVTKRAYADGFSRLHRLRSLTICAAVELDDGSFEAVIRANSSSLLEVDVERPMLSVASLRALGFLCPLLEKFSFGTQQEAEGGAQSAWHSSAALCEFAKAVAASSDDAAPAAAKKRQVRVVVKSEFADDCLKPPGEMPLTGLVTVEDSRGTTYEY